MNEKEALFTKAIDPYTLRVDPNDPRYAVPHTWGLYEIGATKSGPAGKRFRKGNQPVRHQELEREFGNVRVAALFAKEIQSADLASQMNRK